MLGWVLAGHEGGPGHRGDGRDDGVHSFEGALFEEFVEGGHSSFGEDALKEVEGSSV